MRHDRVGDVGRDRLEDDREAARRLQRQRVVEHLPGARRGPALRAVAAEHRRRLRRQPDVTHDRHAGADDRSRTVGRGAAALELDRVAARLLDEAVRGLDRLRVAGLVGPERQVADQQRRLQAAPHGAREHQQLLDGHRHGVGVAEHVVGRGVADQHDVDAGLLDHERARVVVGGDHHDRLAQRPHLGELGERHALALLVLGWAGHGASSLVDAGSAGRHRYGFEDDVVDQANRPDLRRDRDERAGADGAQGGEGEGVDDREVLGLDVAELGERGVADVVRRRARRRRRPRRRRSARARGRGRACGPRARGGRCGSRARARRARARSAAPRSAPACRGRAPSA